MNIKQTTQKIHPLSRKFSKKYEFLQISLNNFVYWRNHNSFNQSFLYNINTTLEQEFLLIKKIPFFSSKINTNLETLKMPLNVGNVVEMHFLPKNFFSTNLPFVQYWIIPFLGFIVFNFKSSDTSPIFPIRSTSSTLEEVKIQSSHLTQKNRLGFPSKLNSLNPKFSNFTTIIFENSERKEGLSLTVKVDNYELKNLCLYYLKHLEQSLDSDSHKTISLYSNPQSVLQMFVNNTFIYKKHYFSSFSWDWFKLNENLHSHKNNINKKLNKISFSASLQNRNKNSDKNFNIDSIKNWNFYSLELPAKLEVILNEDLIQLAQKRNFDFLVQIKQNNLLGNLFYNQLQTQNPIESYKVSNILLDQLLKKTFIQTELNIHSNFLKSDFNSKRIENSKLLNLIDKLSTDTTFEKYGRLIPRSQKNLTNFSNFQNVHTLKKLNLLVLNQTKLQIQEDLDKLLLIKLLKSKNYFKVKQFEMKQNEFLKQKQLKLLQFKNTKNTNFSKNAVSNLLQELVILKKFKILNLKTSNRTTNNSSSNFSNVLNISNFLKTNNKKKISYKRPILLESVLSSRKNSINIFEFKTPLLMTNFKVLKNHYSTISKKVPLKKEFSLSKQSSFSMQWTNGVKSIKKDPNHFFPTKLNKLYFFDFSNFTFQQFLKIFSTKIKMLLKTNENEVALTAQHLSQNIVFFSDQNNELNYVQNYKLSKLKNSNFFKNCEPNFDFEKNQNNVMENQKSAFKLYKKARYLTTSNLIKTFKEPNTEKLLKTYLSAKLNLDKQLIKNPKSIVKLFQTKKKSIKTLRKLKQRLKIQNFKLTQFDRSLKDNFQLISPEVLNQNEVLRNKNLQLNRKTMDLKSNLLKPSQNLSVKSTNSNSLNPNQLFRNIGFIFVTQAENKKMESAKKNDLISFLNESQTFEQVQKRKAQQKKQRRKKQNLETRRRKKRKRFYPRPNWLRFQLYQNFLQKRHKKKLNECAIKVSENIIHKTIPNTLRVFKQIDIFKLDKKRSDSLQGIQTISFLSMASSETKFQKLNLSNFSKVTNKTKCITYPDIKKTTSFKERIYRKNKQKWGLILQDKPYFEKFFFKQIALAPSLPILANQDFYKISNTVMSEFQRLCWKSYWLRSNLTPYIKRIQINLAKLKQSQQVLYSDTISQKFFNLVFGIHVFDNSPFTTFIPRYLFSNPFSLNWYLNYNSSFDHNNPNKSFSITNTKENLWVYDQIINSRLSNIIKNVKINLNTNGQLQTKSFSQGHKKNDIGFAQNNLNQNLYSITSLLQKMFHSSEDQFFLTKPIDLSLHTSYIPLNQLTTLRILWSLNQTNLLAFKQNNDLKTLWESLKIREQNKSNKTKKFILKNFKTIFPVSFNNLCFEKTERIYKKLSWNKSYLTKRNKLMKSEVHFFKNSSKLRNLKLKWKSKNMENFSNLRNSKKQMVWYPGAVYENIRFKKSQKNSSHFWWSNQKNFSAFKIMSYSNSELNMINTYNFRASESILALNILWISAALFHLSILFSFLRISEVRSLMKFYFLIISKISESYFGILNLVYNILNNYGNQLLITTNIMKKEINLLHELNPLHFKNKKCQFEVINSKHSNFISSTSFSKISLIEKCIIRLPQISLTTQNLNSLLKNLNFSNQNKFKNAMYWEIFKPNMFEEILMEQTLKKNQINNTRTKIIFNTKIFHSNKPTFVLERFQSLFLLPIFLVGKYSLLIFDSGLNIFYQILSKIIDILESFIMIIYKFLEKPAELLIDWIGQIFLIEWSNDLISFLPDLLDTNFWISFSKFSRGSRITPILGFFLQRRLSCFLEIFIDSISRADVDLLERQKRGIIFWDIWAEVLIQAAENYKMNLTSFMSLKEEQELFMEKILEDSNWKWSKSSMVAMSPLLSFIGNENCENIHYSLLHSTPKNLLNSVYLNLNSYKLILNDKKDSNRFDPDFINFNSFISTKMKKSTFKFLMDKTVQSDFRFNTNEKEQFSIQSWKRWSTNQSFTYQGIDTDLFVDLHPPKSFKHVQFLRSSELALQTLGPLVCQIYSGIFSKQIAKNILVVGSPGSAKSLFIQALAGETELKIMIDQAQRYAIVQRGVAIGMKLLRDVFDAIALYTPCIFLMEEIHLIGERRPMLISDQENAFINENIFGVDQEEVHEKNQLLYQWSRHMISHYRRPYKSDFSVMIPTNHFCFDLFLGVSPPKVRQTALTPKNPFPIQNIEYQLDGQNMNSTGEFNKSQNQLSEIQLASNRTSFLQFSKDNFFTPPATSPFLIFAMKEQQKIKPKKRVKQMPWGGFSVDQMNLLPKVSYSVRLKVALLADLAIRNLSVKLDMITDLLVILDNVRSNRGFVVFATTHIPSVLDPALRRPGRFDETISLPILPNLFNRWQILKTNLSDFSYTLDFLDYSLITSSLTETALLSLIAQTKLSLFNTVIENRISVENFSIQKKSKQDIFVSPHINLKIKKLMTDLIHLNNFSSPQTQLINKENFENYNSFDFSNSLSKNNMLRTNIKFPIFSLNKGLKVKLEQPILNAGKIKQSYRIHQFKKEKHNANHNCMKKANFSPFLTKNSSILLSLTYFKVGTYFLTHNLANNHHSAQFIMWTSLNPSLTTNEFLFKELYSPKYELKYQVIQFFSGKIAELFSMNSSALYHSPKSNNHVKKQSKVMEKDLVLTQKIFKPFCLNQQFQITGGFDSFWKSATSFMFSSIQKRFLYQPNSITSKLLNFEDFSLLTKPPSPPASTILMPAKKYENFQRTHYDFQQKTKLSINEKLEIHQQQRLIKRLYQKPINTFFSSQLIPNRLTNFNSSWKELSYFDSILMKFTSVNKYYNSRILNRHKFHLIHQWWTGQLAEHNIETTFLSDIDWRSMFVKSLGDLVIDFPDAEQYYNPRSRRWFMNSNSWQYWFNFDKIFANEISSHFLAECFNKASKDLESNRESIDFYAYRFLETGILKEIDLITIKVRFYLK